MGVAHWVVFMGSAMGGAIGGYALAGGFSHRSGEALERGREAVRKAQVTEPLEGPGNLAAAATSDP